MSEAVPDEEVEEPYFDLVDYVDNGVGIDDPWDINEFV